MASRPKLCGRVALAMALTIVQIGPGGQAWAQGSQGGRGAESGKPDLASAKRHYNEAHTKLQAGDVAGALADFRIANDIKATPQAERFIGRCLDSLGQFQEAAEWYAKFLAHVPGGMAAQADKVRARVTEIRAMPGKVRVESNHPGTSVVVDGRAAPVAVPAELELAPGSHVVTWTEAGRAPIEKTIDVAFASQQTVRAEFAEDPPSAVETAPPATPAPAPAPPPQPAEGGGIPTSVFVAGAVAIVAAGVGTAFGLAALDDKSEFDRHPTTQNANNRNVHALAADFSFGVAIVSGLATAFLFFGSRGGSSTPAPAAPPTPAPTSGKADLPNVHALTWTVVPLFDANGAHGAAAGVIVHF